MSQTSPQSPLGGKLTWPLAANNCFSQTPYMGHFKINQQGSISWKEKEMFQSVALQTDLVPSGSAYFKKCLHLFGAAF